MSETKQDGWAEVIGGGASLFGSIGAVWGFIHGGLWGALGGLVVGSVVGAFVPVLILGLFVALVLTIPIGLIALFIYVL